MCLLSRLAIDSRDGMRSASVDVQMTTKYSVIWAIGVAGDVLGHSEVCLRESSYSSNDVHDKAVQYGAGATVSTITQTDGAQQPLYDKPHTYLSGCSLAFLLTSR